MQHAKIVKGSQYHRVEQCEDGVIEVEFQGYDEKPVKHEAWPKGKSFLLDAYLVRTWPNNINYPAVKNAICRAVGIFPFDPAYDATHIKMVTTAREPCQAVEVSSESPQALRENYANLFPQKKPVLSESEGAALDRLLLQVYFCLKQILEACGQQDVIPGKPSGTEGKVNEKFHEIMGYYHQLRGYVHETFCPKTHKIMETEKPRYSLSKLIMGMESGIQEFVDALMEWERVEKHEPISLTGLTSSLQQANQYLLKLELDTVCSETVHATEQLLENSHHDSTLDPSSRL
ncbi:MAG: hypothetical protein KIT56_04545 [Gammaproteobacteria bacterium]|nr:hypothetical protein [Gammaproteobacteria bacterium]MCW5583147.1 hypothetical protein [Gammaproteobacteria bacterium]